MARGKPTQKLNGSNKAVQIPSRKYEHMTKSQLLAHADTIGLKLSMDCIKSKMIQKIRAYECLHDDLYDSDLSEEHLGLALLPKWILFIDEYFNNGFNGTRAYMKVYKTEKEKIARSNAARLLSYESVNQEVQNRLMAMQATEGFITSNLVDIAARRGEKTIGAAVQSLRTLAQTKGMLTEVKKMHFTSDNPATFLPPVSKEKVEEMRDVGRLEE
jgi:hypothetical protein